MEKDQNRRAVAAFAIAAASLLEEKEKSKRRKQRREWRKRRLLWKDEKGLYNNLVSELRLKEQRQYQNYLRMTEETLMSFCLS